MPDEPITLPFTGPDIFGGLAGVKGLAKASPSELVLEFVLKDNVLDVFRSGIKEIRIPRSEVDILRLNRGWFGTNIYIRLKSLKWLADLPSCDSGEVTLIVARRDRDQAAAFVQVMGPVR